MIENRRCILQYVKKTDTMFEPADASVKWLVVGVTLHPKKGKKAIKEKILNRLYFLKD